jgi:putative endonuclease
MDLFDSQSLCVLEMIDKKCYMYVVRCNDGTLYTGVTNSIKRRLHEHNNTSKGAKYTRYRRPVELIYQVEYDTRSFALKAEYKFKQLRRSEKIRIIEGAYET